MLVLIICLSVSGMRTVIAGNTSRGLSTWNLFREDYLSATQTCHTMGFVKQQKANCNQKDIIAFDAELKSPLKGIGSGQKIIFPVIRENIGGGYDAGNGVFTAPLSGVYVFQWTTVVTELVSTETVLVVDGKRRALNKCNSNKANNDSCTKITIVKLAPGERVWIKCILGNSSINDYESSSFIGFRI